MLILSAVYNSKTIPVFPYAFPIICSPLHIQFYVQLETELSWRTNHLPKLAIYLFACPRNLSFNQWVHATETWTDYFHFEIYLLLQVSFLSWWQDSDFFPQLEFQTWPWLRVWTMKRYISCYLSRIFLLESERFPVDHCFTVLIWYCILWV